MKIIVVSGLPGTGRNTLAESIAKELKSDEENIWSGKSSD